jgi:HAD superfamily hydrolase (TIGR01509 family)
MPIQAVIFDMDGLMLDTEPVYRMAWRRASAECGYVMSDEIRLRLVGLTVADAEQVLLEEFGEGFSIVAFRSFRHKFEPAAFDAYGIHKKTGLDELLSFLSSRSVPRAVATSALKARAVPLLKATGLMEQFDVVVTADEVVSGKPSPDLFLLAAQRLGVANTSCLVLEDAESGIQAAHNAEMQVYVVPDLKQPSPAILQLTHGSFATLAEVARHLERIWSDSSPENRTSRELDRTT